MNNCTLNSVLKRLRISWSLKGIPTTANTRFNTVNLKKRKEVLLELAKKDPVLAECVKRVAEHFGIKSKKTVLWFYVRNPLLGDVAPIEMHLMGRTAKLKDFIVDCKNGHAP